jgi:hypothetical protein
MRVFQPSDKPKIYIAGPISIVNAACPRATLESYVATAVAAYFELVKKGYNPYLPHALALYGAELDWFADHDFILPLDFAWLKECAAFVKLRGWEDSFGTIEEEEKAREWGLTIYQTVEEVPDLNGEA